MKSTIDWVFGKDGALFRAAARGTLDLASELLEKGADVNTTSNRGVTPLHRAAQHGHGAVVALLLRMGAEPGVASDAGETALSMAEAGHHSGVVSLLRAQAGDK